jgi:hypothetical protein
MIIIVSTEEFEEGMKELFDNGQLKHFSIDYATNAIHGWDNNQDRIVFKFKGYGFINDNRYNKYDLINDEKGFILEITKT